MMFGTIADYLDIDPASGAESLVKSCHFRRAGFMAKIVADYDRQNSDSKHLLPNHADFCQPETMARYPSIDDEGRYHEFRKPRFAVERCAYDKEYQWINPKLVKDEGVVAVAKMLYCRHYKFLRCIFVILDCCWLPGACPQECWCQLLLCRRWLRCPASAGCICRCINSLI